MTKARDIADIDQQLSSTDSPTFATVTTTAVTGDGSGLTGLATAAQGTTADAALPKAGGAMTGAITTNSTFDGRDVATDGTKLDGIEAFADVTDVTNVTAAGALMDSELTAIASVKALDQGVATTDSPTFDGLSVDTDTLFVDTANNRVGINTSSPATPLDVNGTVTATAFAGDGSALTGVGGSTTFGAVGTYAMAYRHGENLSLQTRGTTISGGSLRPAALSSNDVYVQPTYASYNPNGIIHIGPGSNAATLSGTWRIMGETQNRGISYNDAPLSLYVRIS